MRSMVHTDRLCASRLFRPPDDPQRSVMHFDLAGADAVVVGAVSTEICVAELSEAKRRLAAATQRLLAALQSPRHGTGIRELGQKRSLFRIIRSAWVWGQLKPEPRRDLFGIEWRQLPFRDLDQAAHVNGKLRRFVGDPDERARLGHPGTGVGDEFLVVRRAQGSRRELHNVFEVDRRFGWARRIFGIPHARAGDEFAVPVRTQLAGVLDDHLA